MWQKIFIVVVIVAGLAVLLVPRHSTLPSDGASSVPENRVMASSVQADSALNTTNASATTATAPVASHADSASLRKGSSELFPQSYWIRQPHQTAFSPAQVRQLGLSPKTALFEVSGFLIFSSEQVSSDERNFIVGQPMVMKNQRTGVIGVVTGQLQLTLKDNWSLDAVLRAHRLQVVESFPHLRTYMVVSVVSPVDLVKLKNNIAADPSTQASEIEILSRQYQREGF